MLKTFTGALLASLISAPAFAVVVSDTFADSFNATNGTTFSPGELSEYFAYDTAFDGVAALYNSVSNTVCTGSLISSTAVLTARHCTEGTSVNGWGAYFESATTGYNFTGYGVSSVTTLSPDPGDVSNFFNGTDLAILHLSAPVTDVQPFEVLTETDYIETVAIVGYGTKGLGSTGATEPVDFYRSSALNTFELIGGGYDGNSMLYADFDKADGTENTMQTVLGFSSSATGEVYEGMIAPGDSGGPLLFSRNGTWVVGGVATGVYGFDEAADSDYGDLGAWTSIQSAAAIALITSAGGTIYSTTSTPVPLPASVYLLGISIAGLGMLRRRAA